ncbi:MAG TPA: hypothetical protein VJT09_18555 [Pyrinomonadaceae bacterium]|nr:hypothetical protein [Pyrinomonadaceae bacterium]
MKKLIAFLLICLLPSQTPASDRYGDIKLLDGYKIRKGWAVDAAAWTIFKENGLNIEFEAGMNEGFWADPKEKDKYAWYREQTVNGRKVMLALIKPGLKTVWEPDNPRSPEMGNILLVTFPLGRQADNTANFQAEILNDGELADALLMILTFNPDKY